MRRMVRETRLSPDRLVLPLFAIAGRDASVPIDSLPGHARLSPDLLAATARRAWDLGVPSVLLFGVTDAKDAVGSAAYEPGGVVQTAIAAIKDAVPEMLVVTDVCLCGYTDHGHCGVVVDDTVHNDLSLELLARTAVSHAEAGADVVAPSDMMDGRVVAIRAALDAEGHEDTAIMAYSAKYASAFYGPFREAVDSQLTGDRRTYQMDAANRREAILEVELDLAEGADMVMVKPAMSYLDILADVAAMSPVPVAAYQISGEYSMIEAAAANGWIDRRAAITESVLGIRRAGANMVLTYWASELAGWLKES
jgi:porphobilinogen synthase